MLPTVFLRRPHNPHQVQMRPREVYFVAVPWQQQQQQQQRQRVHWWVLGKMRRMTGRPLGSVDTGREKDQREPWFRGGGGCCELQRSFWQASMSPPWFQHEKAGVLVAFTPTITSHSHPNEAHLCMHSSRAAAKVVSHSAGSRRRRWLWARFNKFSVEKLPCKR